MLNVVLGAPRDDALMAAIGDLIPNDVALVDLEPDDSDARNAERFEAVTSQQPGRCVIGGYSLGARIAATLCETVQPLGLLCFGFPFHRLGDPSDRHGLAALQRVNVPVLIAQGCRDSHGSEATVRGYALSDSIELCWLDDANHRFVPRKRSGLTQAQHIATAASGAARFLESCADGV